MFIVHLALGGCLKAPPVRYGVTADTGGHIAYVLEAARAQAARDDVTQVTIITRLFEEEAWDPVHAQPLEFISEKVTIVRITTGNKAYLEKEALTVELPALAEAFCSYLKSEVHVPDVIHAHFADAVAIAVEARERFGIPFVYTPHALGIDKHKLGLSSATLEARIGQEAQAIAQANAIIVSTHDEAERQVAAYRVANPGSVHRLRPGVPRAERDQASADRAQMLIRGFDRPELPLILAVARPVRKKNLAMLLRAFAGDAKLQGMANLMILAGQHDNASGEERQVVDELLKLASEPALRGKIALPPSHDSRDVTALYDLAAKGGIFVNPALHEPFGLTLIEAASAGVPIVATRDGGPVEIVNTLNNGLLIDPNDAQAIAAACRDLLSDQQAYDRHAKAGLVGVKHYSWAAYAEEAIDIYRRCSTPKLLACDIDNTLTGCMAGAIAFGRWARARDMPFVIATGRCFEDAQRILEQWNLPEPDAFIVGVGSCIMLKGRDGQWRACQEYAAQLDLGWDRAAIARTLRSLKLDRQPRRVQSPYKLSFFGDASTAAAISDVLKAAKLGAKVIHSHETMIDVLPHHGGKAAAVASYAARLGLPISACIAAGDSGNDVDMLMQCGFAIMVGNADDDLSALPPRRGLYCARRHHAAGVLEGLQAHGVRTDFMAAAA